MCIYWDIIIKLNLVSIYRQRIIKILFCFVFLWGEFLRFTSYQLSKIKYNNISYSQHNLHYICMIYLSDNWKFVLLTTFTHFTYLASLASDNHWSLFCFYEFFVLFCCFLDSSYKWEYTVFVFLCLDIFHLA